MKEKIKQQWLKELRSGEWKHGHGRLMNDKDEACCLGVLCDIAVREGIIKPWERTNDGWQVAYHTLLLPRAVIQWAGGLASDNPIIAETSCSLAYCNDNLGLSFKKIADLIERNL